MPLKTSHKSVEAQSPPVDIVRQFREKVPAQVSSSSLDRGFKRSSVINNPHAAFSRDVKKCSLIPSPFPNNKGKTYRIICFIKSYNQNEIGNEKRQAQVSMNDVPQPPRVFTVGSRLVFSIADLVYSPGAVSLFCAALCRWNTNHRNVILTPSFFSRERHLSSDEVKWDGISLIRSNQIGTLGIFNMDAVDFLHHENPPTWPVVEPINSGVQGQRQTNYTPQPVLE
ncbi:hypothetical protein TNCV_1946451 [Trichonephila clavipes]|uniref:Uncharacterized protein n=1 Tax=Trichonephila clavipes TaxID=2585209 RepID=A0A8X6VL23_TRICX|nr:hypothetical protein TNCV_1946451 [Trichonephila clavipes]